MTPEPIRQKAIQLCRDAGFDPHGPTMDVYIPSDPDAVSPWAGFRDDAAKALGVEWPAQEESSE